MTGQDSHFETRRGFLAAAATASAVSILHQPVAAAEPVLANSAPGIVDTHQHLWDLKKFRLPWLSGAPAILNQTYGLQEFAKATEGLNVTRAVYMEVDVHPDEQQREADALIEICRRGGSPTVAAVISGRPASESFAAYVTAFRNTPEIKGVRQVLHPENTEKGYCLQPAFRKSMKVLGELGYSFDLCMRPAELSDGLTLAKDCPGTRFIVDHCGNGDPKAFLSDRVRKSPPSHDPRKWRDDISALANCDNVICKISGIIASAPPGMPFAETLAPLINHCLDAFGPDRVIFGGDWPVCLLGSSYRDWVQTLQEIIASRPTEHQNKLWSGNAQAFYRLSPVSA